MISCTRVIGSAYSSAPSEKMTSWRVVSLVDIRPPGGSVSTRYRRGEQRMKRLAVISHQRHQQLIGDLGRRCARLIAAAALAQERLDRGELRDRVVNLGIGALRVGADRDQILLGTVRRERLAQCPGGPAHLVAGD